MRSDRSREAAALAVALAFLRLGFAYSAGWAPALAGALQVGGLYLVALIFDLLGRRGILFGKFLVLGPLLAGVFLATTPLAFIERISGAEIMPTIMRHVFLGLLIGDTVGFGIEVADLLKVFRVLVVGAGKAPLDEIKAEFIQHPGDQQLVLHGEVNPFPLAAVAERRVVELDLH